VLHLARVDVEAARDDEVRAAAAQRVVAVVASLAEVAGAEPAVDEGSLRCVGSVPVAGAYRGAAHPQLTDRVVRHVAAARIDDAYARAGEREADRARASLACVRVADEHQRLAH